MRKHTLLAVLLGVALVFGVASADDESDRRNLISQIESKLDAAASELSGLERKSDGGDLDDAQGYVREVERLVDDLRRVKGSDSNADRIASSYPDHIRDFRRAADELKKLKQRQPGAAEHLRQCEAFDREMTARAHATRDDPRGADELADFARSVGRKGEELMSEASRQGSEIERGRDDVKRFAASDGRWSNVRSNLHQAAEGIARDWRDHHDRARRACEEVVKRERHREVERVLGRLASSRAGRAELRKKLDELLVTLADRVKDVQSQSSTSNVHGAIELTKELDSQLERLRNASGDDGESRRIASSWPPWARELRESLEALKELKHNQSRSDDGASKCEAAEQGLQDRIRRSVGDTAQHERAIRELPEDADRVGGPIKSGIEKASDFDRQMESWANKARSFSQSEGPWGRVTSNLRDSSERVFKHWRESFDRMKKACERIMLGKDHPDVRRAVGEMSRDTRAAGDSYRGLRDEFDRWKSAVDKLREFSAQDVEEIRRELCAATDHDELGRVNEIADRWAAQLTSLYGSITGMADRIKRAADDLIAKRRALKAAPKAKEAVDAILESVDKLKNHQLQGSNNPLLKARAQYGVDQHAAMQRSCDAKEITISSSYCRNPNSKRSDCRLDCVKGCTIVEIKPAGDAEDLGRRQAQAYADGLQTMYREKGAGMFEGPFARFRSCVSPDGKSLAVTAKVETYQFCPAATDLGPRLERVDRQLPREAE